MTKKKYTALVTNVDFVKVGGKRCVSAMFKTHIYNKDSKVHIPTKGCRFTIGPITKTVVRNGRQIIYTSASAYQVV